MIRNNNKKIITKLVHRSISSGKMRNIFLLLTIALSVALLSGFAFGSSVIYENEIRKLEERQHAIYHNITEEQMKSIASDDRVESIVPYKIGKSVEEKNYIMRPVFYSTVESRIKTVELTEGFYPEKKNEIAVDKGYMKKIGREAKLGETVTVEFLDGTKEDFILTGFTDNKLDTNVYELYLSEQYAVSGTQLKEVPYQGAVQIQGASGMSKTEFLEVIRSIGSDYGIERKLVNENNMFTNMLTMGNQELGMVIIVGIIILGISILVIYSIFYISIVERIRQFGQLRTLGTTKKQIQRMIRREGSILCAIGAPIGLLIGGIFAYCLEPNGFQVAKISMMAAIILIADYLTVMIAIKKPAKLAATVSPVEASKLSGYEEKAQKKDAKKLKRKLTPGNLARIGAARNKKRSMLTSISLGVGGILFLTGTTILVSMDEEEYSRQGWFRYGNYSVYLSQNAAEAMEHSYTSLQQNNPMNEELIKKLLEIDGVTKVDTAQKLTVNYEYETISEKDSVVGFDRNQEEMLQNYVKDGIVDYDKMIEEKGIIICNNEVMEEIFGLKFKVGDEIKLRWFNGADTVEEEFKIVGTVDNKMARDEDGYQLYFYADWFIIPKDLMNSMVSSNLNLNRALVIDTENGDKEKETEASIRQVIEEIPTLRMDTFQEALISHSSMFQTLFVTTLGFALFIIAFSLINLINTLITNVMSRKQEFAMLQSIGMSNRQLNHMIQGEGLILTFYNVLITLTVGTACGYLLVEVMRLAGASYMLYQMPVFYMIAYALLLLIAPIIISSIAIKIFRKKSLVERIREGN